VSKIDNLEDLARHLNKNKEDISEQDVHDHIDEFMDFFDIKEDPWVLLDGGYSKEDLRLILEFMALREQNKR
jgi:hypothetical protein